MRHSYPRKHVTKIGLQNLEDRRMLAAFGTPWPDARELTISFPSDGVAIKQDVNNIKATLDQVAPRQEWQELALRAYQTWAINADLNVGLRNDYDVKFGTPGLTSKDPRFGEFRIGAFPQLGVLANSVPFQAIAGTHSGDLLLNSNESFKFHDWNDGLPPDPASLETGDRDLFSLLLHEAGNTLGIADNLDLDSVMYGRYVGPKGELTADDIASIQALYGQRSDPFEQFDNGQVQTAAIIPTPVGLDPATQVIRSPGSLSSGSDVDTYRIDPIAGQTDVTIRLRSAGISLLMSTLQVLDEAGQVIGESTSASVFNNDNVVQIGGLSTHAALYVRVLPADASDIYSVGDYLIEVDYRDASVQASGPVSAGYQSGSESVFANFDLVDSDDVVGGTVAQAQPIAANSFGESLKYEVESSISYAGDLDFWKITAPANVEGRLLVQVAGVGTDRPDMRLVVVDGAGQPVGTAARLQSDGTFSVEVAQPDPGQDYFVRISVDPTSTVGVGNYVAVAEFQTPNSQMNHMATGQVSQEADDFIRWTSSEARLFQFSLLAEGSSPDQAIRLTIYDAHTKQVQMIVVAQAGVTRGGYAWLQEGDYIFRFSAIVAGQDDPSQVGYSLFIDGISDDQDDQDDGDTDDGYVYDYYYAYEPYQGSPYYYYDAYWYMDYYGYGSYT